MVDLDQQEKTKVLEIIKDLEEFCKCMGDHENKRNIWLQKIKILKDYIEQND
jgi:hypothetical protein